MLMLLSIAKQLSLEAKYTIFSVHSVCILLWKQVFFQKTSKPFEYQSLMKAMKFKLLPNITVLEEPHYYLIPLVAKMFQVKIV